MNQQKEHTGLQVPDAGAWTFAMKATITVENEGAGGGGGITNQALAGTATVNRGTPHPAVSHRSLSASWGGPQRALSTPCLETAQ